MDGVERRRARAVQVSGRRQPRAGRGGAGVGSRNHRGGAHENRAQAGARMLRVLCASQAVVVSGCGLRRVMAGAGFSGLRLWAWSRRGDFPLFR